MDAEKLKDLVERKHRVRIDDDDPMFMLATISEVLLAEARIELQRIVAEGMNQASAVNVQAEAAARAKAEAIVTKAGEWAAAQIKAAGEAASARILADTQKIQAEAAISAHRLKWATIVAAVCGFVALSAAVSTVVAVWTA